MKLGDIKQPDTEPRNSAALTEAAKEEEKLKDKLHRSHAFEHDQKLLDFYKKHHPSYYRQLISLEN